MTSRLNEWYNKISISKKITLIYSVFFLILIVAIASVMLINAWAYYNRLSRSELEETAQNIVSYIEESGDVDEDSIEELNPNKYVKVVVTEKNSKRGADVSEHGFPSPEFEPKSLSDEEKHDFKTGRFNNQQYMYTMRFARYDGKEYSVQVFRPQNREIEVMRIFVIIFLVVIVVATFISSKIGRFISKKTLDPIREMTATVDKITAEELGRRIELPAADDEFRALALTFNNMFDRLEDSFEKQKQFVSDASHELRTPISVIQGYANLVDRWGKSDKEVLDEAISSIKSETEHMSILINQLLFLAREDKGTTAINKEKINLYELAKEVASECEMTSEDTSCTLSGDEGAMIFADSHLIKQVMRIITENAVKYTKNKPCVIEMNISKNNGKVRIGIKDNGVGMPKEDVPHIFDRFFRGDKSRNKQIPGNGLGLSIAYSVVQKHNGKIWAESEQGKGSTFYLEFEEV
jgi:heavy metal sensor kinase